MSRKRTATVLDEQSAAASATIEAATHPTPIPAADQVAPAASISAQSAASLAGGAAALPGAGSADASAVAAAAGGAPPSSPGRNRLLFLAAMTPQHMTCDLSNAVVGLGVKHNLESIIIAIFPVQNGPPARRHVLVRDQHGTTGITVWHNDVHKFPKCVLGAVLHITRASMSLYQGKKNLVLNKDSTVVVNSTTPSPLATWWAGLAASCPLPLPAAITAAENSIINVFGVIGFTSQDHKEVNGVFRQVSSIYLVSQTAKLQLRGWDLEADTYAHILTLQDKVVKVLRIRITSYADTKIGEILDSPLGTSFHRFADAELERHWQD